MIYSTDLANNTVASGRNNKYLEAGIHENVKLVSARVDKSPIQGNLFIEVKFEKDGKELIFTGWEPKKRDTDTEESMQTKATNQVTRITRILRCFYAKSALTFSGNSFSEFASWAVGMLNAADKTKLLKLKTVYNRDGYVSLPTYVSFAFIEPMVIPEGFYDDNSTESKITKLDGMDIFTKPVVADVEQKDTNPLAAAETTSPVDDLPF